MADPEEAATEGAIEDRARRQVAVVSWRDLVGHLEDFGSWGRRSSLWPFTFGLACCGIEMICAAASRFDLVRFGAGLFRASPRQADLMIISGTVTKKMIPVIVRLYDQMAEPKYIISMGACANGGGPFKEGYNVVSGVDEFLPVDVYVRGCPPTPQALLDGLIELQARIDGEPFLAAWRRRRRPEIPVPRLGPDLVDARQSDAIHSSLTRGEPQRLRKPAALPAKRPVMKSGAPASAGLAKEAAALLARKYGPGAVAEAGGALVIDPGIWDRAAADLKDGLGCDYLADLTAADYSDAFEVVYHLYRTGNPGLAGPAQPALAVKVRAGRENPKVPSVMGVWPGADLMEREVWDMFGVGFAGRADLKRILMWEGFAGHPLRKDWLEPYYEEPRKMFSSRWREGRYTGAEFRIRWGRNCVYPEGFDPGVPGGATVAAEANPGAGGTRRLLVSLGPQHPSTHGVFQMRALLEGERVVKLEPVVGYLHRNHEKIGERNTYIMNIPYTDRLDYLSSLANNLAYVTAVEKLAGIQVAERAEYIRVIMAELTRIANHLWVTGALLNDLGAFFTPMLYMIKERELILDLFEMTTGSRMMCNYMRFSGVARDLPAEFLPLARRLVAERLPRAVDQLEEYLTKNEIVQARCRGVGVLPAAKAIAYSASGPLLRGSGVPYDIRKAEPYSIYDRFKFDVACFPEGDVYARYRVRIEEVRQSIRILMQALDGIPAGGPVIVKNQYLVRPPEGEVYSRCENPKGELGFYLVSDGSESPYRYHVRAPSFVNLTALEEMCRGHLIADAVAILGSIDIVLGETDR
jgi:NADH-quinone oxidoreductase B subunit